MTDRPDAEWKLPWTALKSTGFEGYDRKIEEGLLLRRRYRPVEIEGKPGTICTAQMFIHRNEPSQGE